MSVFQSMTSVDGVVSPTDKASIPVLDRGFLYGDSIYEVFRTYRGVPLFYEEHWGRLENSARLIRMNIGFTMDEVGEVIRETIRASGAPESGTDVYVRYIVTRGAGPVDLYPSDDLPTRLVVIVKEVPRWNPDHYTNGLRLAIAQTRRNPLDALDPNIKGGNYLNNVLGVIDARSLGADDCLMLSDAGLITEASNSNVFFVIDGRLVTPAQSAANLRGLTKLAIHDICAGTGIASDERDITEDDAARASECFVTSATREVMPALSLRLENGQVREFPAGGGELTRRVAALYKEHVEAYIAGHGQYSMF